MDLNERFVEFVRRNNFFHPDDMLLCAVSGGVDSVVLIELLHRAGFRFMIAHCNFRLRDQESERDSDFVRTLAKNYNVDFLLKEFDTKKYASDNKLSLQEAARQLRYEWFYECLDKLKHTPHSQDSRPGPPDSPLSSPAWILTAHHADDNIETMLMNFFRGTGIQGLRGILSKQGKLVRPLLPFRKSELLAFATDTGLRWMEDSSNETDKYSRNQFRRNIIPAIKSIYPEVEQNLLNNLQRFSDIEILYNQSVQYHLKRLLECKGNEIHIPILKLKKSQPLITIVHEIIKPYNFSTGQVDEVTRLLDAETGRYVQSATHRIIVNRKWLIITPVITTQATNILIENIDETINFELGTLRFEKHENLSKIPGALKKNTGIQSQERTKNHATTNQSQQTSMLQNFTADAALLNGAGITFPLLLRKWKAGDYFYPLGMDAKKKKIARFLIDQKLSRSGKENVWVIEMNKKIIWVVGLRIDNRFKVTNESSPVLSIALERQQI